MSLHVDGLHAPELAFSFEQRKSGIGFGSALGAHIVFAIIAILIYTYSPNPGVSGPITNRVPSQIVWLQQPGPGGGGGGGGNEMPEPPKKAEVPGKDKISVPVVKKEITPQPKLEEPKDPAFNIPAKTLGDAQQMTPGMRQAFEPEGRQLRQHLPFIGNAGREDVIERRDAISRDDQERIAKIVDVADFSSAEKRQM